MKLRHISNACCLYEAEGFRLLADPWLTEPIFDGSWYHDPPLKTLPEDVADVDAVYISHIHEDHCDEATLRHLPRDTPIFVLRDKLMLCVRHLEKMGFTNVEACLDGGGYGFGPFRFGIFGPWTKHPHHDCDVGNVIDSAMLITYGDQSILNCNDNTMSLEAARRFRRRYGAPTVAQLNSNAAGCYPATFLNLTHDEKLAEKERIVRRQTDHMVEVAKALGARVVQPFAGAYRLGGKVAHLNQYLAVWPPEKIAEYARERGVNAVALKENEVLDLDTL